MIFQDFSEAFRFQRVFNKILKRFQRHSNEILIKFKDLKADIDTKKIWFQGIRFRDFNKVLIRFISRYDSNCKVSMRRHFKDILTKFQ